MFVLFENKPDLKLGKVSSSTVGHLHVESIYGKHQKVKNKSILLKWEKPVADAQLMIHAEQLSSDLDVSFLWECCSTTPFTFIQLAQDYYGNNRNATIAEQIAILLCLRRSPIFFRRMPEGLFQRVEAEQLQAALVGLERRKLQEEAIEAMVVQLQEKSLPDHWQNDWPRILFEKHAQPSLEIRALEKAAKALSMTPAACLHHCGAFPDWEDFHTSQFIFTHYPDTVALERHHTALDITKPNNDLWPIHHLSVPIITIDESSTDEIDDALSIETLQDGYRIGIHIAAPALLANQKDLERVDDIRRFSERMSTIYCPSNKIPMMGKRNDQDNWVDKFSLDENQVRPVVSLYVYTDQQWRIQHYQTILEQLRIDKNLRLETIEDAFNSAIIEQKTCDMGDCSEYVNTLMGLWAFAQKCFKQRQEKMAHIATDQLEYRFTINNGYVDIKSRPRGLPMETLVAELMILTNHIWSTQLRNWQIPAIYRVKDEDKVGFSTTPGSHKTMGLDCYGWFTSPLRRFVDFINQRQLIDWVRHMPNIGILTFPVTKPNHRLPEIIRVKKQLTKSTEVWVESLSLDFERIASRANMLQGVYTEFQHKMERYWCLRWIQQKNRPSYTAILKYQGRYPIWRLVDIPLTIKLSNEVTGKLIQQDVKEIQLCIKHVDEEALTVIASFVENV